MTERMGYKNETYWYEGNYGYTDMDGVDRYCVDKCQLVDKGNTYPVKERTTVMEFRNREDARSVSIGLNYARPFEGKLVDILIRQTREQQECRYSSAIRNVS